MKKYACKYFLFFLLIVHVQLHASKSSRGIFIPDYLHLQYAGSIGVVSGGAGYSYLDNVLETGIMLGYLPGEIGFDFPLSITLKQTYIPFSIDITNKLHLKPIATGIFINKIFEDDLFTRARSDYPKGYYWWSETIRLHFFLGTRAGITFNNGEKVLEFTAEMNTNELYFSSYVLDQYLSLADVFKFSAGLKYYW